MDQNKSQGEQGMSVEDMKAELKKLPLNEQVQKAVGDLGLRMRSRYYENMGFMGFRLTTCPDEKQGVREEDVMSVDKKDIELSEECKRLIKLNGDLCDQLSQKCEGAKNDILAKGNRLTRGISLIGLGFVRRLWNRKTLERLNRSNLELTNDTDVLRLAVSLEERIYGSAIGQNPELSEEEMQEEYKKLEDVIDRVANTL